MRFSEYIQIYVYTHVRTHTHAHSNILQILQRPEQILDVQCLKIFGKCHTFSHNKRTDTECDQNGLQRI